MANLVTVTNIDSSSLASYLEKVSKIPSLSQEEELEAARSYSIKQDNISAQKLVGSHLKMVVKIAISYKNYGIPIQDLISEGNIGLIYALKKFDPELGNRFSTYAMWWVKATMQDYILKSWSLVKIGTTTAQKKLFFSLRKLKARISSVTNKKISSEDYLKIANDLGVSYQEVIDMDKRLSFKDSSLNMPSMLNDEGAEMITLIPDAKANQENITLNSQIASLKRQIISEAVDLLNERERDIFLQRNMLENPSTLEELSAKYNISKERVRQIEARSFEKVKLYILNHKKSKDITYAN
jgi:RNA polymerase sigma-32 factor